MRIQVTQDDIDKGIRGDMFNCPIVLALKRDLGNDKSYRIIPDNTEGLGILEICELEVGDRTLALSNEMNTFAKKFDAEEEVRPFEFEIP